MQISQHIVFTQVQSPHNSWLCSLFPYHIVPWFFETEVWNIFFDVLFFWAYPKIPSYQFSSWWNADAAPSAITHLTCSHVLLRWAVLPGVDTVDVCADDRDDYQGQTESLRPPDAPWSWQYSTEAEPGLCGGNCWLLWPRTHTLRPLHSHENSTVQTLIGGQ